MIVNANVWHRYKQLYFTVGPSIMSKVHTSLSGYKRPEIKKSKTILYKFTDSRVTVQYKNELKKSVEKRLNSPDSYKWK